MPARLAALQKRIGHTFRHPALLTEALTHGSWLQDNPDGGAHNQRLEFLGDAVLHFVLTDALYRTFPLEREGVLSRRRAALTKGGFLSQLARDLGLDHCLHLGRSEEESGGRTRASILEDALEALAGAIYLDSDLATAQRVVLAWYGSLDARLALLEDAENPKGRLQELIQPSHGNDALRYEVISTSGPRHARVYEVAVHLHAKELGAGRGSSKKTAEEAAARVALAALRKGSGGGLK
ncbi:MAG TPA: ribonuclease III [Opitutaceae bacterium]|nr:ribonuclease III [Opitutaceae bacterium]